jgi:hypothetical protein
MVVWYSLWSFGIFFPFWHISTKKNLATLLRMRDTTPEGTFLNYIHSVGANSLAPRQWLGASFYLHRREQSQIQQWLGAKLAPRRQVFCRRDNPFKKLPSGASPTITSYSASVVKIHSATNSIASFSNKKYFPHM